MSGRKYSNLKIGSRVQYSILINNLKKRVYGTLAYGPGPFHVKPNENDWCGVVLDEPLGKNNGSIQGKQYFDCADNHGVMVRASTLVLKSDGSRIPAPGQSSSRSTTPSSTPSMTPSSSIASFTGMFDSGSGGKMETSGNSPKQMSESVNASTSSGISRLRPPTKIKSINNQNISKQELVAPSNIRKMVENLETKRDEKLREESDTQHISGYKPTGQSSIDNAASTKEINEEHERINDLESKLATLMAVRQQDKQKFKDLERLRIQNEQLLENKRQMAERIAELTRLKEAAEKMAMEANEQKDQNDEIRDLTDDLEMAVIDKEMAEEKAEHLKMELDQVKEQLEEALIDFELLKSEIEEKGADGAANSFQVKQLEEKNNRYQEAMHKIRDISAADKSKIQFYEKELESKTEEITHLTQWKDKHIGEVEKYRETITELTEQVDMALGSQEMVEKLTEKNLELEDKVEELQKALDEEENIKDLSNMIIEEKDEIIADLRDELDRYKTNLVNLKNSYIAMQEAVNDHENTIKKFREVVSALREENTMLRAAQQQDLTKVQQAVDVQKQLENIEFKTRLLDRRDLSRAIDMELRQLDIDQCYRYMVYVTRFFPESFFIRGGDHDAISVLMFIPRIFMKCSIIERQILDKFSGDYNRDQTVTSTDTILREVFTISNDTSNNSQPALQVEQLDRLKQQIFSKHILYLLCSIRSILDKYQDVLSKCDSEVFLKLGSLFPEIAPYEKRIDHYVDLLRNDKLDETVTLDSLEGTLIYLQSLYNIHMAGTEIQQPQQTNENHNKFLNDLLDVFRTGTEASILDVKILSQLVQSDASLSVTSLETTLNDIDQFCRKIRRRMVSAGGGSSDSTPACIVRFPIPVEAELFDCVHNLTNSIRCLKTIRSALLLQFVNQNINQNNVGDANEQESSLNYFSLDELDKTCRDLTANNFKAIGAMLSNVMSGVCKLSTSLQQGDYDVPKSNDQNESLNSLSSGTLSMQQFSSLSSIQNLFSSSNSANQNKSNLQSMQCLPLDERAIKWRAQSDQIGEFRNKILIHEADIVELKRALKAKIDEISEMQIRKDIAEKKLSTALKDAAKVQDEFDLLKKEFKEKEAEKEKTLNKYNQENNELYSDLRMMKEKLKDYSKSAMSGKMGVSPNTSLNLSLSSQPLSLNTSSVRSELQSISSTTIMGPSTNSDVNELQQQIFDLRSAMKRLAKRNYDLRMMLSESPKIKNESVTSIEANSVKPQWYTDTLKHLNGKDAKDLKLQELRNKLLDFKYEVMRSRCQNSIIPKIDNSDMKPGWTRSLGDLLKKSAQHESLREMELSKRYRELRLEVEQFLKTFDDGFSCDAEHASFLAPHISKAIESKAHLVARITVPATGKKIHSDVIPVEVTMNELRNICASLIF